MNPTIRPMPWFEWVVFVLLVFGVAGFLHACGDDDEAIDIDMSEVTWNVTTDPWGREYACLGIASHWNAGGLYCVPAPVAP